MKATEKNYAIERVESIRRDKEIELSNRFDMDWRGNVRTIQAEKIAAIKNGTAKIKEQIAVSNDNPSLDEVYDWPFSDAKAKQQATYESLKAKLNSEAQKVKDELMLGDSQTALEMLRKFEGSDNVR